MREVVSKYYKISPDTKTARAVKSWADVHFIKQDYRNLLKRYKITTVFKGWESFYCVRSCRGLSGYDMIKDRFFICGKYFKIKKQSLPLSFWKKVNVMYKKYVHAVRVNKKYTVSILDLVGFTMGVYNDCILLYVRGYSDTIVQNNPELLEISRDEWYCLLRNYEGTK